MKAILDGGRLVLIVSVVASITTLVGVFYPAYFSPSALFGLDAFLHEHQLVSVAGHEAEATPLPRMIDDLLKQNVKAGDAVRARNLVIQEDFIDPDNHCEFCQRYEYTPGAAGKAGIAYGTDNGKAINLSGAKKVSFFVMGEEGGEKLKFKVGGRDSNSQSTGEGADRSDRSIRDPRDTSAAQRGIDNARASALAVKDDLFSGKAFAKTTEEVSLADDWKKYEIDLSGVDLANTENPFAIEILKKSGNAKQVFYVKGITFDTEPAVAPLSTVDANTTLLDGNVTALNQTELASINGTANATGIDAGDTENRTATTNANTRADENQTSLESAESDNVTSRLQETESENQNNDTSDRREDTEGQPNSAFETENQRPIATVSPDEILAHPGDAIILDATESEDPDGDNLTFSWDSEDDAIEFTDNEDSRTPTARVSSEFDEDTEITVELVVSDGNLESEPFEVTIVVDYFGPAEVPKDEAFSEAEELRFEAEPIELSDEQLETDQLGTIGNWNPNSECSEGTTDCLSDESDDTAVSTEKDSADLFMFDTSELLDSETEISINYVSAEIEARSTSEETGSSAPTAFVSFVMYDEERQEYHLTPPISIASDSFENYSYRWPTSPINDDEWDDTLEQSLPVGYVYSGGNSGTEVSEFRLTISYYESQPQDDEPAAEVEEEETEEEPESEEESSEGPIEEESGQSDNSDTGRNATDTESDRTVEEEPEGSSNDNQNNTTSTE